MEGREEGEEGSRRKGKEEGSVERRRKGRGGGKRAEGEGEGGKSGR